MSSTLEIVTLKASKDEDYQIIKKHDGLKLIAWLLDGLAKLLCDSELLKPKSARALEVAEKTLCSL
jgi:hypothetical protein